MHFQMSESAHLFFYNGDGGDVVGIFGKKNAGFC